MDAGGNPFPWKATEHNADVYAAFMNLYLATGDPAWQEQAASAKRFLESMWHEEGGFFWTGTLADGVSINPSPIPEDAQSWTLLALGEIRRYGRSLTWAESTLYDESCPACGTVGDYRFSDTGSDCWWEGTAHMALAWQAANDLERADALLQSLRSVLQVLPNTAEAIPAACEMDAVTGFGFSYPAQVPYIGVTAWYLFSELQYNPFWGVNTAEPALVAGTDTAFLDSIAFRAFQYFWEEASPQTGLVKDRANNFGRDEYTIASTAATGFGLTALCVGVERGWVTPESGYERALTTLRFFRDEMENVHGFYYHFVDVNTGERMWASEVSSIDTALFLAGALTVGQCFPDTKVEALANELYTQADFQWLLTGDGTRPDELLLSHGWKPETGFISYRWDSYSEHMILGCANELSCEFTGRPPRPAYGVVKGPPRPWPTQLSDKLFVDPDFVFIGDWFTHTSHPPRKLGSLGQTKGNLCRFYDLCPRSSLYAPIQPCLDRFSRFGRRFGV